jgi:hypothetical protein
MYPLTVVRAQKPKEKAPMKQEEISMSFKKPFKLTACQIEQPPVKVCNVPNIVHIIERKVNKKGVITKIDVNGPPRVHIIEQPKGGKKGFRMTNE